MQLVDPNLHGSGQGSDPNFQMMVHLPFSALLLSFHSLSFFFVFSLDHISTAIRMVTYHSLTIKKTEQWGWQF